MIRISKHLHDLLKIKAKAEGRTLEWAADDALREYLDEFKGLKDIVDDSTDVAEYESIQPGKLIKDKPYQSGGLTYRPMDEWSA